MQLKKTLKSKLRNVFSLLKYGMYYLDHFNQRDTILLMAPAPLDGSFGDDLMIVSFVEQNKDRPITIYSQRTVQRDDILSKYDNIRYHSWSDRLNFKFYSDVVLVGADNLTGSYGEVYPIHKLNILKEANRKGLRTRVLGFSLTENTSSNIKDKISELTPNTIFKLREIDSYTRANKIVPKENIQLVADLAFLCNYQKDFVSDNYKNWTSEQKEMKRNIVGVCPNAYQANKVGLENYCDTFVSSLLESNKQNEMSFVFLYHDIRPHCEDLSDREVSKKIYDVLKTKTNVYFEPNIVNGVELKPYLDFVDFIISGRMHFGISGYSLLKPMIGISYEEKFTGLQKHFEIDVAYSLVKFTELHKLSVVIKEFVLRLDEYKSRVNKNISKVKELAQLNFE